MKDYTRYVMEVADVMVIWNLPPEIVSKLEGVLSHTFVRGDSTPEQGRANTVCIRTWDNMNIIIDHLGFEKGWRIGASPAYNFPLGTWECKDSPYKVCVYDHSVDPAHDFCLICGKPDERK